MPLKLLMVFSAPISATSKNFVFIQPGQTAVAVMPLGFSSTFNARV